MVGFAEILFAGVVGIVGLVEDTDLLGVGVAVVVLVVVIVPAAIIVPVAVIVPVIVVVPVVVDFDLVDNSLGISFLGVDLAFDFVQ